MAFHPYPHVIPRVFNLCEFGPPRGFTRASSCTWVDHLASGYDARDSSPASDSLSLRLRLCGSGSPRTSGRRFMMQKVQDRSASRHGAFLACRHTVSGSFHSPLRGSFRLSLAVLVHYRSAGSIQAWEMVLPDSARVPRVPAYLGYPPALQPVSPTGLSPCAVGLSRPFDYRLEVPSAAPQPRPSLLGRFGLLPFRSPLLRESLLLSFPPGTEMFHFPGFACGRPWIRRPMTGHCSRRVSPFGHPRITAWLAAPRGFSQPPASFVASDCLGIHRVPFAAWSPPPLRLPPSPGHSRARLPAGLRVEDGDFCRAASPDAAPCLLALLLILSRPRNVLSPFRGSHDSRTSVSSLLRSCQRTRFPARLPARRRAHVKMVELIGFEPTTSSLQSWRSPS